MLYVNVGLLLVIWAFDVYTGLVVEAEGDV